MTVKQIVENLLVHGIYLKCRVCNKHATRMISFHSSYNSWSTEPFCDHHSIKDFDRKGSEKGAEYQELDVAPTIRSAYNFLENG